MRGKVARMMRRHADMMQTRLAMPRTGIIAAMKDDWQQSSQERKWYIKDRLQRMGTPTF